MDLVIERASPSDTGIATCTALNQYGSASISANINVLGKLLHFSASQHQPLSQLPFAVANRNIDPQVQVRFRLTASLSNSGPLLISEVTVFCALADLIMVFLYKTIIL